MKKHVTLFSAQIIILCLCACTAAQPEQGAKASLSPTWQEQYDLGVRYLSEGNYQEAIIAFTAAIEIDPKQAPAYVGRGDAYVNSGETEENLTAAVADYEKAIELDETATEAYLGLADVYIRQGDYEMALEILRHGLEKAENDQKVIDKIKEIEALYIPAMVEAGDYSFLFTDDVVKLQDWIVNGKPVDECDLADFQADFPDKSEGKFSGTYENGWHYSPTSDSWGSRCNVDVDRYDSEWGDTTLYIRLHGEAAQHDFYFQPNLRNIKTGDTYVEILQKIGFSEEGIQYLTTAEETFSCDIPGLNIEFCFKYSDYSDEDLCIRGIEFYSSDRNNPSNDYSEMWFHFYNEKLEEIFFRFRRVLD